MPPKAKHTKDTSSATIGFDATALCASAFLQTGGTLQVMAERQDNFGKDDDVRWQPSGAKQIAKGNPQGERGGVHQFGAPPKGNANFTWVQHFIHHLAPHDMSERISF